MVPEAQVYEPLAARWWRCGEVVEPLAGGDHLERVGFGGCALPVEPHFLSQLCTLILGEKMLCHKLPAPSKEPSLPCILPPINCSQKESSLSFLAKVTVTNPAPLIQYVSRLIQYAPYSAAPQAQPFHKTKNSLGNLFPNPLHTRGIETFSHR